MKKKVVLGISSAGGVGYLPMAPGTFGTLVAIPVWWIFSEFSLVAYIALTAALTVIAIWASSEANKIYEDHDASQIVIDEVVGLLCAAVAVPFEWKQIIVVFLLFRFFDILKPPPVRWLDKNVKGGVGVVLDDVVAGFQACGCMHVARLLYGSWW
jgi:phosphatidylglycerophosphatase A